MALTVRLGPKAERALSSLAKRHRLSRSEVVREALARYEVEAESGDRDSPYHAWADVIGVVDLGVRDAARTTGEQFADLLRKRSSRRAR